MVKFNFSFTYEEVYLIFDALIFLRRMCDNYDVRESIDDFLSSNDMYEIILNEEKLNGC